MAVRSAPRLVVTVCDAAGAPVRVPGLAAWLVGIAPRAARGTVTLVVTSDMLVPTIRPPTFVAKLPPVPRRCSGKTLGKYSPR